METKFDLHRIHFIDYIFLVSLIGGMIVGPFWYLFQFEPTIFQSNGLATLIILCLAMSLPVFMSFFIPMIGGHRLITRRAFMMVVYVCGIFCCIVFYAPCSLTLVEKVSSKEALYMSCAAWSVCFVCCMILCGLFYTSKFRIDDDYKIAGDNKDFPPSNTKEVD